MAISAALLNQQERRIAEVNRQVAAAIGIDAPRLKVSTLGSAAAPVGVRPALRANRPATLTYPLAVAVEASDAAVLGTIAHEQHHILFGDHQYRKWKHFARTLVVLTAAVVGPVAVPRLVLPTLISILGKPAAVAAALGAIAIAGIALMRVLPTLLRPDAVAAERRWRELRCDLASVQVVGRDAVVAMLAGIARREPDAATSREWLDRLIGQMPQTHPATTDRMTAVRAYDPTQPPGPAAREFLDALPATAIGTTAAEWPLTRQGMKE